jgi:peptidoglycan/LPS O-acetylase OafA/YrhL
MSDRSTTSRLGTIDALRALAALLVAWFHFTNGGPLLSPGWLKLSGAYGWIGVEVFFVISGFIIPYSLYRSGYKSSDFGMFLAKRIARLDPPYVVDILLMIAISYVVPFAPGFRGEWPHYTASQLLCHIGYINSIVGKPWVNVVFWSLAIEFQYYLLIGLTFPLLIDRRRWLRFTFLGVLLVVSIFARNGSLVFGWLPLFVAGILTFQCKAELISTRTLLFGLAVTGTLSCFVNGPVVGTVTTATALIIRFVELRSSRLSKLGLISYSIYLLHVPIGGKIVNMGSRLGHNLAIELLVLAIAMAGTLLAAVAFYRFIELPSQRLSSSLRYRRCQPDIAPAALVAVAAGE